MPEIKQQRWKIVEYSKRQINDAGNIIRKDNTTAEELAFATQVIDNWRAAHAYPMHVIYIHLRRMAAPRNDILVVERLKRLDSIIGKLRRETRMDLWRMQDLGGCRFITPSVDEVFHFAEEYKKSRVRHEYKRTYDYIHNPKPSGYRSLHLVYKYHSEKKDASENLPKKKVFDAEVAGGKGNIPWKRIAKGGAVAAGLAGGAALGKSLYDKYSGKSKEGN